MKLIQLLDQPISGHWNGGPKNYFEWRITSTIPGKDSRGEFVRIGSWAANYWFHVAKGKTEKLTLSYAKKRLRRMFKVPCTFEYEE